MVKLILEADNFEKTEIKKNKNKEEQSTNEKGSTRINIKEKGYGLYFV